MNRGHFITLIDILMFCALIALVSTGILMQFLLPPGSEKWVTVWTMNRQVWGEIHFWAAVGVFVMLLGHLLAQREFVLSCFRGRLSEHSRRRVKLGLLTLIALLAIVVALFLSPVETSVESHGVQRKSLMLENY